MSPRTTRILLAAALLLTLAAAGFAPQGQEPVVEAARGAPARAPAGKLPRSGASAPIVDVLRIRAREDGDDAPDALLFSSTEWTRPDAPVVAAAPAPQATAAQQAPPLPFLVLGSHVQGGQTVVFLQQNDQNYVVRVGDTIGAQYKVESLDGAVMKLRYLPLDQIQTLELGRTLKEK